MEIHVYMYMYFFLSFFLSTSPIASCICIYMDMYMYTLYRHVHVQLYMYIHVHGHVLYMYIIHDIIRKERKKERKKDTWGNGKMKNESCLRWDSNPRHTVLHVHVKAAHQKWINIHVHIHLKHKNWNKDLTIVDPVKWKQEWYSFQIWRLVLTTHTASVYIVVLINN